MVGYEAARAELLDAEVALMQQREQVASLRRALPPGPIIKDYTFADVDGPVTLSQLSTDPDRPLIVYHFMFGGLQESPCPMCSLWADGWNGIAEHMATRVDFALVTQADPAANVALANARGWNNLRWLSAADSDFKTAFGSMDADGNQWPFFTVFERDGDDLRLSWSGGAHLRDEHWRGVDLLSPVWHLLDLTRSGRGEWMPSL